MPVDVRVIAATSRDVRKLLQEQRLREDLYFRRAELTVTVPPLRERLADLPLIASSILESFGSSQVLTAAATTRLRRHSWPSNVRELRNSLKRAVVAAGDAAVLGAEHFEALDPLALGASAAPAPFKFPGMVRGIALHALSEDALPTFATKSQYEQRELQRAALLYLAPTEPQLSPGLTTQWQRLFGPRWATSENGRGLKELLRALGRAVGDRAAREWVLGRVG